MISLILIALLVEINFLLLLVKINEVKKDIGNVINSLWIATQHVYGREKKLIIENFKEEQEKLEKGNLYGRPWKEECDTSNRR